MIAAVGGLYLWLRPVPLQNYIPADSLGYVQVPHLAKVTSLLQDESILDRALGNQQASAARQWFDRFLKNIASPDNQKLNSLEVGLLLTDAAVEPEQTVTIHGVLMVRPKSLWIRHLNVSARHIADKLAKTDSSISSETIRGEEVVVVAGSQFRQQIFIATHREAVLLSNNRESMAAVLATMDGQAPPITTSSAWKNSPPQFKDNALVKGYFVGSAMLNLLRDFLVKNYASFEDPARTSRFLSSLGLDQVPSIEYSALHGRDGVEEHWEYRVAPSPEFSQSFLGLFLNQRSNGPEIIPIAMLPANTVAVHYISISDSSDLWKALTRSLGILTNQEAPQNRDLMIAVFEGALGFRIQRDLLQNLSGEIAVAQIENRPEKPLPLSAYLGGSQSGSIIVLKANDPPAIKTVLSKIVSEGHPPHQQNIGSVPIFYSDLAKGKSGSVEEFLGAVPAFGVRGNLFYFCTNRNLLAENLALAGPIAAKQLQFPSGIKTDSPLLSIKFSAATQAPSINAPLQKLGGTILGVSQLTPNPGGFEYLRYSPCGLPCEIAGMLQFDQ